MDSMQSVFIYENTQLLEQLETTLLAGERNTTLSKGQLDEIFRVMHTLKGAAMMMEYEGISTLSHAVEDLFDYIRSNTIDGALWAPVFDTVLSAIDFFKGEIEKLQAGLAPTGDASILHGQVKQLYAKLRGEAQAATAPAAVPHIALPADPPLYQPDTASIPQGERLFQARIVFEPDCGMETVRAFGVVAALQGLYSKIIHFPENIDTNQDDQISANGFLLFIFTHEDPQVILDKLGQTLLAQSVEFSQLNDAAKIPTSAPEVSDIGRAAPPATASSQPVIAIAQPAVKNGGAETTPVNGNGDNGIRQNFISVNVSKIDQLMDLVGEIVTTEAMVVKNPDLNGLVLENFEKQARLLRKLTTELQDVVMSIRMVPISATFRKMQRVVRDVSKKTGKEAELVIIGEETEVDKNAIDHLSDPLMHLIRNAMDHGLEAAETRESLGKPAMGRITLEARNSGGDVVISISDDGKGLDKNAIIQKAIDRGLTAKSPSSISDKEAFSFILEPGFSTNTSITELSGRGVGMDVVNQNIQALGGSIVIDSQAGKGTTISLHIPLTLAIVDGMKVEVGDQSYIIPILNIWESVEPRLFETVQDPSGKEMVMIRGECLEVLRLYKRFGVEGAVTNLKEGILVIVQTDSGRACLLVDRLAGEQQAVIKPVPTYLTKAVGQIDSIAGCTILGDGSVCLILNINHLLLSV